MKVLELNYYERLKKDYLKHGSLFVAYDFDNTVFDYHDQGVDYIEIIELLRVCNNLGFKLILFTANEGADLIKAERYLKNYDIPFDYVNRNPIMDTRKPYYNILLDDRAGLIESFNNLKKLTDAIRNKEI